MQTQTEKLNSFPSRILVNVGKLTMGVLHIIIIYNFKA